MDEDLFLSDNVNRFENFCRINCNPLTPSLFPNFDLQMKFNVEKKILLLYKNP